MLTKLGKFGTLKTQQPDAVNAWLPLATTCTEEVQGHDLLLFLHARMRASSFFLRPTFAAPARAGSAAGGWLAEGSGMTCLRATDSTDRTAVARVTIEDERLSFAARGLLSFLLSKPDNWEIEIAHIIDSSPSSRDHVYSLLHELADFGYAVKIAIREQGKFKSWRWIIYEIPSNKITNRTNKIESFIIKDKHNQGSLNGDKKGYVYFIYCDSDESIKIGFSKNPKTRLKSLQTANPSSLILLKYVPGNMEDEWKIQDKFKHLLVNGEWYKATRELTSFIQDLAHFTDEVQR